MRSAKSVTMKEKIRVIHHSDIEGYLSRLQQNKKIDPADLVCACCSTPITAANFGGMACLAGKIVFSCKNESCLLSLAATNLGTPECK